MVVSYALCTFEYIGIFERLHYKYGMKYVYTELYTQQSFGFTKHIFLA